MCGSGGWEFHIIPKEQRDVKRNRLKTRSQLAGWMDYFMNMKHIPDNLKKKKRTVIWLKVPTQRFDTLLGVRKFYLLGL